MIGLAVLLVETTATDQFLVPPFSHSLNGWSFVPPLVAIGMADPLVDRTPQLTEHATRSPATVALGRLGLAFGGALAVAAYSSHSPGGPWVAQCTVAFAAVAVGSAALLAGWYWVPLLPLSFAWLQQTHGSFPAPSFAISAPVLIAVVAVAGLAYTGSAFVRAAPR